MNLKKRDWSLVFHKDGDNLVIHEARTFKQRRQLFTFYLVDELTYHVIEPILMGKWAWKIPVGKPKWDAEYNMWDKSVGSVTYDLISKALLKLWDVHDDTTVLEIPITKEQAIKLEPDMEFLYDDE